MLSGPPDSKGDDAVVTADGSPIKTYTIDLRRREQATDPNTAAAMPPPELPTPETAVAEPVPQAGEPKTAAPATTESAVAQVTESERDVEKPARQPERSPVSESSPPTSKPDSKPESKPEHSGAAWAVQVASLDSRPAAEKIVGELKGDGFAAFVMPVEVNGKTKFRVRVGPVATRPAADVLLTKVKRVHAGATVMRHP